MSALLRSKVLYVYGPLFWAIVSKNTRFIIYKKQKMQNVFIYKKQDILQKARQFPLRSVTQKAYLGTCVRPEVLETIVQNKVP